MEKHHTKSIVNIITLNSENFLEEKSYQKIENDAYWQNNLSNQEYNITRLKHTERAFSSIDHNTISLGLYYCICCNNILFNSKEKYNSFTGWPSFYKPFNDKNVDYIQDKKHTEERVEVICKVCDAHLGHVFDDGPQPTGLRYCINRKALLFIEGNRKEKPTIDLKEIEINNYLNQNNNEHKILSLKVTKKLQTDIWSKLKKRLFF